MAQTSRRSLIASAASVMIAQNRVTSMTHAQATDSTSASGLTDQITTYMEQAGIPGCIYLVHEPGKDPVVTALGNSDVSSSTPMTPDMHVRIGSITKSFTATITLQMIDEGLLAFDGTLSELIPDASAIPHADRITLHHLLTMTSGIADYLEHPSFTETFTFNQTDDLMLDQLVELVVNQHPAFLPGEGAGYSNSNYWLLGHLISSVANAPFAQVVSDRITSPLGLHETSEPTGRTMANLSARGYTWRSETRQATPSASPEPSLATPASPSKMRNVTEVNVTWAGGAGSLVSTVREVDTFISALNDGTLLSPEMSRSQLTCVHNLDGLMYGMGVIELIGTRGHGGNIDGFASWACQDIETGTNYVVVTNVDPTKDGSAGHLTVLAMISGKSLPSR